MDDALQLYAQLLDELEHYFVNPLSTDQYTRERQLKNIAILKELLKVLIRPN